MKTVEQKAKRVPAIRFAGFDDEWVEKKLGDTITIERGGSPRPIENFITENENGLNWVKIGDAPEQGNYITHTSEKIIPEGLSKTREVHPGDLILSNSMSFGRPYIMAIDGCIHDGWLLIRNSKCNYDLTFLCVLLGTENMLCQYKAMAAGSTVNNLNKELVASTKVSFPEVDEQQKLGSFFSNIDSLISLEQKKYDKLTQVKKSMLEKMFPKEGATVPEIRFAGFTGDWEEKKLGDTVLLRGRIGFRGYKETDLVPKGMGAITFSPADIDETGFISLENNKYLSWQKYDESPEIQVKVGDILFTKTASIGKVGYVQLLSNKATINPQFALLSPNENMNGYFIFLSVRNDSFMKKVKGITGGSSVPTMSQEKLKELTFLKTSIDEQNKIGSYFSHLDSLISLQQSKLEKLKNIKKSLLEKMFV